MAAAKLLVSWLRPHACRVHHMCRPGRRTEDRSRVDLGERRLHLGPAHHLAALCIHGSMGFYRIRRSEPMAGCARAHRHTKGGGREGWGGHADGGRTRRICSRERRSSLVAAPALAPPPPPPPPAPFRTRAGISMDGLAVSVACGCFETGVSTTQTRLVGLEVIAEAKKRREAGEKGHDHLLLIDWKDVCAPRPPRLIDNPALNPLIHLNQQPRNIGKSARPMFDPRHQAVG